MYGAIRFSGNGFDAKLEIDSQATGFVIKGIEQVRAGGHIEAIAA
jgi:hypothetical protein